MKKGEKKQNKNKHFQDHESNIGHWSIWDVPLPLDFPLTDHSGHLGLSVISIRI